MRTVYIADDGTRFKEELNNLKEVKEKLNEVCK